MTDWKQKGACVGQWEIFDTAKYLETAQQICGRCPVLKQCFEAGKKEKTGIWGGVLRSGGNPK